MKFPNNWDNNWVNPCGEIDIGGVDFIIPMIDNDAEEQCKHEMETIKLLEDLCLKTC